MDKELVVLVHDEPLGVVTQLQSGRLAFEYDRSWQNAVDAFPLSLSMPLGQQTHPHSVIQAYIDGLLPDDANVRKGIARHYKLPSDTPFRLAAAVGEDLAGAVQMVPHRKLSSMKRRGGTTLVSEETLDEWFSSRKRNLGLVQITEDAGFFSLAGAQTKKALCYVNGKWFEPKGRTPTTHIVKPPVPGFDGQVENEHFCLRLASRVGLPTCRSEVMHIAGKPYIVVERYDRQRRKGARLLPLTEAGGTVVRLHQEDMCQALAVPPERKYQAEGGPGMKAIMAILSGSGSPGVDRSRFMRACAFNFIILGTDAHAKNFSILIEHGRYRLAPLYDVISLLPYKRDVLNSRVLAMSVGGQNKWRMMRLGHWQNAATENKYPSDEIVNHLRDLLRRLPDMAQTVRRQCREDGLTTPVLTRLATAIAKRCGQIGKSYGF
jgi:serine/threonine-protein kinase HipA